MEEDYENLSTEDMIKILKKKGLTVAKANFPFVQMERPPDFRD